MSYTRIDLLALSKGVDELLKDNDIDPAYVIEWLVEEELIDLSDYFEEEEDEDE